tara:strand:+ start:23632 stop:24396 length:765 start_codon:yes stop_codon:yes gene_type:complete
LGLGVTNLLLSEGIEVWATSRNPAKLPHHEKLHPIALDLSMKDSVEKLFSEELSDDIEFDLLINNAGSGVFYSFESFPEEEIGDQAEVMMLGPIRICQRLYGGMKARDRGVIVNVSSLAAKFPLPFMSMYNAAKSGLSGFSASLMLEAWRSKVIVIDFQPADLRTDFNNQIRKEERMFKGQGELGRSWRKLESHTLRSPHVDKAVRMLRNLLLNPRHGRFTTGGFTQALLAPFITRFLSWRFRIHLIRNYYGLK